ncbi:MAG TPA: DNRLRE domain-containing protein, partial [Candidatus Polarisedimenticolia bacterium]|nr:DNRLRE domain-containing protein [Candidatus Polarisedimenticolia bacterium]
MEAKSLKGSRIRSIRSVFACVFTLAIGSADVRAEFAYITPQKDGTLIENFAGSFANGSGPAIFAGRVSSLTDPRRRALLAFDIAGSIPAGSTIASATLILYMSGTNAGPVEVSLHRVDAEWGEGASSSSGGGGAASETGDATWVHRFYDSEFWASPGGDFDFTPHGVSTVDQIGPYLWSSTPEMVADVQSWLDDPAGNHGWILLGDETRPTTVKRFDSRESLDESARPLLAVDYIPPCSPDPRGLGYWQHQCSDDEDAVTTGPPKE